MKKSLKMTVMLIFIVIFTCLPSCINLSNIKDDIQDDLNLIFELCHDRNDTRLHKIYLKCDIQIYLELLNKYLLQI